MSNRVCVCGWSQVMTLFRIERFMLDETTEQKISQFAIILEYEKLKEKLSTYLLRFILFSFHSFSCYFILLLIVFFVWSFHQVSTTYVWRAWYYNINLHVSNLLIEMPFYNVLDRDGLLENSGRLSPKNKKKIYIIVWVVLCRIHSKRIISQK